MEERIKDMYNDCWKIYKEYLVAHDVDKFSQNGAYLREKYENQQDIIDLLFWFAARIYTLHEAYKEGLLNAGN